ncbi:LuxR C-terminal-related transcriptional regulator [Streptomyces sp. NPDC086080]|uniref:LuxR C-terminal-related transcriptional regulator n=1 Tax=Streptomyces sp. NPDC086080 TaxID=3365748 RepID=UPI0037D60F59
MKTVVLVGGPTLVRAAVARVIEGSQFLDVVGEAPDEAGLADLPHGSAQADVVLLTRTVPSPDVPALAESVAAASATARTVVLGVVDAQEADACLRAGATGVLAADVTASQLVAALETVVRGGLVVVLGTAQVRAAPRGRTTGPDVLGTLSLRERQILTMLAGGQDGPAIAAALRISPLTVKTHITHLLSKIGVRRRGHAIAFAYEHGLVVPGATPVGAFVGQLREAS